MEGIDTEAQLCFAASNLESALVLLRHIEDITFAIISKAARAEGPEDMAFLAYCCETDLKDAHTLMGALGTVVEKARDEAQAAWDAVAQ